MWTAERKFAMLRTFKTETTNVDIVIAMLCPLIPGTSRQQYWQELLFPYKIFVLLAFLYLNESYLTFYK